MRPLGNKLIGLGLILTGLTACESIYNQHEEVVELSDVIENVDSGAGVDEIMDANRTDHDTENPVTYKETEASLIRFMGQTVQEDAEGVNFRNQVLYIGTAGIYRLTGTLDEGQIQIDTEDEDPVILILDGVSITCSQSAPLFVANASCTVIDLLPQTENHFIDGNNYSFEGDDEEPDACIFSKDDLTITGEGSLVVQGNYEDGIVSKDGLVIRGGELSIQAVDDGIRGRDYLVIKEGTLLVEAGGDGLKSTNEDDAGCGYVYVASGTLQIYAGGDAIHAVSDALVREVIFEATSGGGASEVLNSAASAKGIKGSVYTVIDGGSFTFNSADDAVHSNRIMIINGGLFSIATGDDAFHADSLLVINDIQAGVTECYEGVESAVISMNGGEFQIVSSDDGINVAAGNDGSGKRPGQQGQDGPGGDQFASSGDYFFFMEDGYMAVNSRGDGLDVNGAVVMKEGTLILDGPSSNMNSALDYDRSFTMDGGFLLGTGSSGMAQAPGSGSGQPSILVNFNTSMQAGTLVHLETGSGGSLFTFAPSKSYQSVVFSSPDLEKGTSYQLYYGGSTSGNFADGLLVDGSYSPGTEYREFTISGTTTLIH